jgi:short-subunit dehydrogenase
MSADPASTRRAVITGASSGIGAEFARLCAAAGYGVVLIARRRGRLDSLAAELAKQYGIGVRILPADLADPAAPQQIFDALREEPVEILINNAGIGLHGLFAESERGAEWEAERRLMQVNMTAPVHLAKLFLPGMLARRSGRILNVASTAAFVPGPLMALYYASKAFLLSFSLAVSNEVHGTGVTVTALCPGPTRTEFFDAAGIADSRLFQGSAMAANAVAREGYDAMMAGKAEVIAGARNRWMILGTRLAPRSWLAKLARRLNSSVE